MNSPLTPVPLIKICDVTTDFKTVGSGNGHCILNCFATHFQESAGFVITRLRKEMLLKNMDMYVKFSELSSDEIYFELEHYTNTRLRHYNTTTVDMVLDALSKIYQCHILILLSENSVIDLIGNQFSDKVYLFRNGDHTCCISE